MSPASRYSRILPALFLLMGCSSLTVKEPVCEPPPIPASLLQACPLPEPIKDGRLETLYLQAIADTGPWGECLRRQQSLVELVKYRDQVCVQFRNQNPPANNWWQW